MLKYFRSKFFPHMILLGILLLGGVLLTIHAAETGTIRNETKSFTRDLARETRVNFHDLELTVPPGANETMTVSLGNLDLTGIEIPFGVKLIRAYQFGPSGSRFAEAKKIRFRLKWNPVEYPGGLPGGMCLYYVNRESKKLEFGGGIINEQTGDFEGEIPHFSEWAIGISANWMGDSLNPYADYIH